MARELRNISGETLSVDNGRGLEVVRPGEIYVVAATDDREWPLGLTGEKPIWEEVTKASKAATKKENG